MSYVVGHYNGILQFAGVDRGASGDAHYSVKLSLRLQANEATASRVAEAAPTVQHGTAELNPTSSTERH
jgi:hypothetical protein